MTFAYTTYILPILKYCSSVWNPAKLEDIDRIESVQRHFTKRLHGLCLKNYSERLTACSLHSLELRCLIADIVLCYKIVHGLVALNCNDFFTIDPNCITRGHNSKIYKSQMGYTTPTKTNPVRIVPVWSALPSSLVNSASLQQFKHGLELFNFSKFLRRDYDAFK